MNEAVSPTRRYVYVRAMVAKSFGRIEPGDISFIIRPVVVRAEDVVEGDWESAAIEAGWRDDETVRAGVVFNELAIQIGECATDELRIQVSNPALPDELSTGTL